MGLFDRVERKLDRVINGAFARAFRAEVQPVEIASAMRRAMDERATVVSRGRTLVPNSFVIELDANDHRRLTQYGSVLEDELIASVEEHADSQHYRPGGPWHVEFRVRDDLDTGVFRVRPSASGSAGADRHGSEDGSGHPERSEGDVRRRQHDPYGSPTRRPLPRPRNDPAPAEAVASAEGDVRLAGNAAAAAAGAAAGTAAAGHAGDLWSQHDGFEGEAREEPRASRHGGDADATRAHPAAAVEQPAPDPSQRPYLDLDGDTYPLLGPITVLGRDSSADIALSDAGISRRHAEVRITHDGPHLVVNLRDLDSTNGTFVNGDRITSTRLRDGDRITMGRVSITLRTRGRTS